MSQLTSQPATPLAVPPLRDGDEMDRDEFFRRYEASPNVTRAELIEGIVHIISRRVVTSEGEIVVSPTSRFRHGRPHSKLLAWLEQYASSTPGVDASGPASVYGLSPGSAPEPDGTLCVLPEFGGQSRTDEDGDQHGPPELVIEIANTSAAYDLGPKRRTYAAEGVAEYIVWRTVDDIIDWFHLNGTSYTPLVPNSDGVVRSATFPGLWLNVPAMLAFNMAAVFQTVQAGFATPEHAAFVAQLQAVAANRGNS